MSSQLDALIAQVQATNEVMASAVTLINGLKAQLAEVQAELAAQGVTSAKLDELTAALDKGDDGLQALLNPPAADPPAAAPADPAPADPAPVDPAPADVPADPAPVDPVADPANSDPSADAASS